LCFDLAVAIRASSGKLIDALLADLSSDNGMRRDAAIARLTVSGGRAVERVTDLADDPGAAPSARAAAFRVLEAIGDSRALDAALRGITDANESVSLAAIGAARPFLKSSRGLSAVDHLTGIVMDPQRPTPVRLAAIHALRDLDPQTVQPLLTAIKADPVPEIAAAAVQADSDLAAALDPLQCLIDAAAGTLPHDPEMLRRALSQRGGDLPLPSLHRIVKRIRDREAAEPAAQLAWTAARGAAHVVLADRGSRLALYDLREALEGAVAPLPVEFVAAVTEIGNLSCLEPLAGAYARTGGANHPDWWRRHLAAAFRAIVARERLTRRHAVIRKIEKKWGLAIYD
jgi:HEAT repeat protein